MGWAQHGVVVVFGGIVFLGDVAVVVDVGKRGGCMRRRFVKRFLRCSRSRAMHCSRLRRGDVASVSVVGFGSRGGSVEVFASGVVAVVVVEGGGEQVVVVTVVVAVTAAGAEDFVVVGVGGPAAGL